MALFGKIKKQVMHGGIDSLTNSGWQILTPHPDPLPYWHNNPPRGEGITLAKYCLPYLFMLSFFYINK
jgi:hypothetical protein